MASKRKKKEARIVAVGDFETDPFLYGREPKPFSCGLMYEIPGVEKIYVEFWGDDCVEQLLKHLYDIKTPLLIYFHNGGKFDFFFFLKHLQNPVKIIHGRIVKAFIGIHEFRDSWAIIPMPLGSYKKDSIDYAIMEREVRNEPSNRATISDYLYHDCLYLHDLVVAFNDRFGPRLTIAGTAGKELRKFHPQYNQKEPHDKLFRPFYFGGRVECFKSGVIKGKWKVYDVNSMYPFVMRNCLHPIGSGYVTPASLTLDKEGWFTGFANHFYFIVVSGWNSGALPVRVKDNNGGLSFTVPYGTFHTTSHELRLALTLGLFRVDQIIDAYIPRQTQSFAEFVDTFVAEKITAKKSKDKIAETFAKLILNSAYGRFGINPFDFWDYHIQVSGDARPEGETKSGAEWEPYEQNDDYTLWRRRVNDECEPGEESTATGFEDVAIAASITSAARAVLMLAIVQSRNPAYCDTDSLICEALGNGCVQSETELGGWKYEGQGDELAIAGKKLYALFDKGVDVKSASKGVKLSASEIREVASGGTILWENDAPNFSLLGGVRFVSRHARSTSQRP